MARLHLRTEEAARRKDLRGRDEHEYIAELYSQNTVFVTSDAEFVEDVRASKTKHAGIIYVPNRLTIAEQEDFVEIAAVFVRGSCKSSIFGFRDCIVFPGHDGFRLMRPKQGNQLAFSWHWLREVRSDE